MIAEEEATSLSAFAAGSPGTIQETVSQETTVPGRLGKEAAKIPAVAAGLIAEEAEAASLPTTSAGSVGSRPAPHPADQQLAPHTSGDVDQGANLQVLYR